MSRSLHGDTLAQDTPVRIERVEALDDVHHRQCVGTPAVARAEEGEAPIICPCILRLSRVIRQGLGCDDQCQGEGISCDQANYDGDPYIARYCVGETSEVESYESGKSPYGLYDMAGNVFEWTSSLNTAYPYGPADGREDPGVDGERVALGGGWTTIHPIYYRGKLDPSKFLSFFGIRCAHSLP